MKIVQDVTLIAATAILTALLAGPLLGPGVAGAGDEAAAPTTPAALHVLTEGTFQLSLTLDKESYEPGQTPVVLFKAVHTGDEAADLNARVRMRSTSPEMFVSRMPRLPDQPFDQPISLKLEPGETKILRLPTKVPLKAGSENMFDIVFGEKHTLGRHLTLPLPEGAARLAVRNGFRIVAPAVEILSVAKPEAVEAKTDAK